MNTRKHHLHLAAVLMGLTVWTGTQADAQSVDKPEPAVSTNFADPAPDWESIESGNRVEGIRKRIDVLKNILATKKAEADAARAAAENAAQEATAQSIRSQPAVAANQEGSSKKTQPDPAEIELVPPSTAPATADAPASSNIQRPEKQPDDRPEQMVIESSKPVNSFELANSLFATGSYAQALKHYQVLLDDEDSQNDRVWLKCLAANCHRIAGNIAQAEKLYREVAAVHQQIYPSDHAKWYLDYLTRRKQIETELKNINAELKSYSSSQR